MRPDPEPSPSPGVSSVGSAYLDASPNAIVAVGADGAIRYANPQALAFFGWSASEMIGMPVERLMPASVSSRHVAFRRAYQQSPTARPMGVGRELVGRRKDGSEFPAEISLVPVETADEPLVFATVVDVSVRRALEQQLLEARKMESVGRLAGGIAHDFNNVLTAVIGYADLLLADDATPDLRTGLGAIKSGAERAAALTQQLLAFSRRQMLQPQVHDPNEIVAASETILRPLLGEDVELVVSLTPGVGAIRADRGQFEQVLIDLALFARDAMPDGGRLVIGTERTAVEESDPARHFDLAPGDYVVVSMADTGRGMDDETRAHVFEPFYTSRPFGGGSGLGLATAYGIVKQSGGHIWVHSERGHGSTFRIYLPVAGGERQTVQPLSAAPPARSARILLVEDEPMLRQLSREVLLRSGFVVEAAGSPAEALRMSQADDAPPADVLVSDVIMPGISGIDLAHRLRTANPSLLILLMSGYAEDVAGAREMRGAGFLAKPFTPTALVGAIHALLDGRAAPAFDR